MQRDKGNAGTLTEAAKIKKPASIVGPLPEMLVAVQLLYELHASPDLGC